MLRPMNGRLNASSVLAVVCHKQLLHRPRALSRGGTLTLGATLAGISDWWQIGGSGFQLKIKKVFKWVKLRVSGKLSIQHGSLVRI
jgi:hypothetical protein